MAINYKYKAAELREAVERCMAYCIDNNKPPVDFVLHKFTPISADAIVDYIKWAKEMEDGKRERDADLMEAAEVLKKWQEFKTVFWLEIGMNDPKLSAFAIFNLKQPCNGGYSDKPLGTVGNIEINIDTEGVGGGKAFK